MKPGELSEYMKEIGRRGGRARALSTTPAQRRRIARKAARASVKVRRAQAAAQRRLDARARKDPELESWP